MKYRFIKIALLVLFIGSVTLDSIKAEEWITPSLTYDSSIGNYIIKYGPVSSPVTLIYEIPNKVNPSVNASVESVGEGIYQYRYKLYNGEGSLQKLYAFEIGYWQSVISAESPDEGWSAGSYAFKPVWGWTDTKYLERDGIPHGQSLEGFSLKAHGLPGIVNGYFQGYVKMMEFPYEPPDEIEEPLTEIGWNLEKSYVSRKTLGPTAPPADFKPVDFISSIINMKHEAFSLGWITNQGIEQSLDAKLDNAKKKIEQGNITAAKNILEAFINEVEAQGCETYENCPSGKHLIPEAYALMKYNVQYLINKL